MKYLFKQVIYNKYFSSFIALFTKVIEKQIQINSLNKLKNEKNITISSCAFFGKNSMFHISEKIINLVIKDNFVSRSNFNVYMSSESTLLIGENVFFNNFCSVNCLDKIEIGNNTILGEGVKIYDHNHKYHYDHNLVIEQNEFNKAPVIIGNNCWIGSNVTILKGVTIGDNVIVGANCLIYKSIPSNSIVKHREDLIIETRESNV
jgi:acetyltransferase-like isoleucine patch superfamily enzyme